MDDFVTRYIIEAESGRFMMFDDKEDVDEWDDTVLEVTIPATTAALFTAVNMAYFGFQEYCGQVWEMAKEIIEGTNDVDAAFLAITNKLTSGDSDDSEND